MVEVVDVVRYRRHPNHNKSSLISINGFTATQTPALNMISWKRLFLFNLLQSTAARVRLYAY